MNMINFTNTAITPDKSFCLLAALSPILIRSFPHLLKCCIGGAVSPVAGGLHSVQPDGCQQEPRYYSDAGNALRVEETPGVKKFPLNLRCSGMYSG